MNMNILIEFSKWMKDNTTLKYSSIEEYSRSVNAISNEMMDKGYISKSLFNMTEIELDIFIDKIFKDIDFIAKNKKCDRKYSNGLKQLRSYKKADNKMYIMKEDVENTINNYADLTETERISLIKSRVGQGMFRDNLLEKYGGTCVITGINEKRLLIASHVKPWAVCSNEERLSVENGLLLSPTFDKLFDNGLITFSENGKLFISSYLNKDTVEKLSVTDGEVFDLKVTPELAHNLQYHQAYIFITKGPRKGIKRL